MRLACPVKPGEAAIIDARHRAFVNHETYFVSSDSALREFQRNPLRYCGLVTDPVSGERFRPTSKSPRHDHGGRPYWFVSEETRARFRRDPARFATPKRAMPKPASPVKG